MPLPWKKVKSARISRLVNDHLHNSQKRRDGSSLVVETGFPTSLIDLFIKNREKLKTQSKKKRRNPPNTPVNDVEIVESPPCLSPPQPPPPSIADSPLRCPSPLHNLSVQRSPSICESEVCVVDGVCERDGYDERVGDVGYKVLFGVFKVFLVVVLGLWTKRLAVGITISAFLLLFLEYVGKHLNVSSVVIRLSRLDEKKRNQVVEIQIVDEIQETEAMEEVVMEEENLPDDLQRGIRRHLFKLNKVRIFKVLDEPIVDAMCERLRTKTYIKGSKILDSGGVVDKMVFIIRGKMVSTGEDGIASYLSEGDVCGEELLSWCLESWVHKDGARIRIPGERLLSTRVVSCLTNTEAFVLGAEDVEQVTRVFARFLRRVQGAIRYDSPYWKGVAVRRIQSAWRRRKRRINQASGMEGKA